MPVRIRCPHCQSLMQVPDSAAGKRTKCPKCAAIVSVPTDAARPAPQAPAPHPPASTGGAAKTPQPKPAPPKPPGPPKPSGAAPAPHRPPASAANAKQVRCPRCQQVMRAAAGATVQCPKCQATVKIPAPGSRPASAPQSPSSSGFDFDDLPGPSSFGGGPLGPASFGGSSFGPSSLGTGKPKSKASGPSFPSFSKPASGGWSPPAGNPYAATAGPYAAGGAARGGGSLPSGRSAWHYAVPGAIFDILGALMILGVISRIGIAIWIVVQGRVNAENLPWFIGQLAIALAVSLPIAVAYLMGGSAMIRRTNLSAARTAAVIGCIPCFNCVVLTPIGIWAAILVFSDKAQRDFSD